MTQSVKLNDSAVSPVVGVMLMLVVVIIIAALVSAFGGSLMQTDDKAPQASVTGRYSQTGGLIMTHSGGESLVPRTLLVIIRPGPEFGTDQTETTAKIVNLSFIRTTELDSSGAPIFWRNASTGVSFIHSWRPGENMYVVGDDLIASGITPDYPPCYRPISSMPGGGNPCYADSLNNQINVGKTVTLEIAQVDGKMISTSKMIIEP